MNYKQAIAAAKRNVVVYENRHAYVCRDKDEFGREEFVVMSACEYEEDVRAEEKCVAVLWSYMDAGAMKVAMETQEDW